jgi:pyruvate kinase
MSTSPVEATLAELEALLAEVQRATPDGASLAKLSPAHRLGAVNLAHYLVLRAHDLRRLQPRLAELGLSSLGRAEAHVEATLLSVRRALRRLCGATTEAELSQGPDFAAARAALAHNADALLGPAPAGRAVRIMVTADATLADSLEIVRGLLKRGMTILRVNCAHDNPATWTRIVKNLRSAERELGIPCRVLMDLGGPKIRTGPMAPGPKVVTWKVHRDLRGQVLVPTTVWLVPPEESPPWAGSTLHFPEEWLESLQEGELLTFRDARGRRRALRVVQREGNVVRTETDRRAYIVEETLFRRTDEDREVPPVGLPPVEMSIELAPGESLILTRSMEPGRPEVRDQTGQIREPGRIGCTESSIFDQVRVGQPVLLDDGKFESEVVKVAPEWLELRITRGPLPRGKLGAGKGINFPETGLEVPAFTVQDEGDLQSVVQLADLVGMSFVQRAEDVQNLCAELDRLGGTHLGLVLKIETTRAFAELPALFRAAMQKKRVGVMIARGDLAVECGYQRLAEVQEELLWLCEAAHLPAIWATQVLEGLAKNGVPTRAEVTDAAMGERAECVMLNKGSHILEAVSALDDILRRMEEHQSKKTAQLRALKSWRAN